MFFCHCITLINTSKTLVCTAPTICSKHCDIPTPLLPFTVCMVTGMTLPRLDNCEFQNLVLLE